MEDPILQREVEGIQMVSKRSKGASEKSCKKSLRVNAGRCSQCGLCIGVCPQGIIYFSPQIEFKDDGEYCGLCVMICPEEAIEKV